MSLFHQEHYPKKKRKFPAILHIEEGCRENHILVTGSDFCFRTYDIEHQAFSHDFQGHKNGITAVKRIPEEENLVLTTSWDKTCKVWDLRSGLCVRTFGSKTSLHSIASNGVMVVVGGDKNLSYFDLASGNQLLFQRNMHSDEITNLSFFPGSCTELYSSSPDGQVNVFDLSVDDEDLALDACFRNLTCVSNFGFYGYDYSKLWVTSLSGAVEVFNIDDAAPIVELRRRDLANSLDIHDLICCVPTPDQEDLVMVGANINGDLILAAHSTGEVMFRFTSAHKHLVKDVLFYKDFLISGDDDGVLCFWKQGGTQI